MAAFAAQGMALSGDQLQPEVTQFLDYVEGKSQVDLSRMPYPRAETFRAMEREFLAHYRPAASPLRKKMKPEEITPEDREVARKATVAVVAIFVYAALAGKETEATSENRDLVNARRAFTKAEAFLTVAEETGHDLMSLASQIMAL